MYSDLGPVRSSKTNPGQSWAGEFPVDTMAITLDADLCLAKFPDGDVPSGTVLGRVTATGRYAPYSGTTDERQRLTFGGTVSGGTYTITYAGQTTTSIAWNASAAVVQAAVAALSNVGAGNVSVSGGPGPTALDLQFTGSLANTDVTQVTVTASLTGTSPTLSVSTVTAGGADGSSDGAQVARGHLLGSKSVRAGGHCEAALYYKGRVFEDALPALAGLDPAAKADLNAIVYVKKVG